MNNKREDMENYSINPLTDVMQTLLGSDGCPWDKKQDHHTLRKNLLEEAHEVIEAIDNEDMTHLQEELGDLLLQIVFHAQLAKQAGFFDLNDVINGIVSKLIRRHPHIFGEMALEDEQAVLSSWEQIKLQEKGGGQEASIMSELPPTLPALMQAEKVQEKARRVGFDWTDIMGPWLKIQEELDELKLALDGQGDVQDELGDVLFSVVNVARFIKVDPEEALKKTTKKFIGRFQYIESKAKLDKKSLEDYTIVELDAFWEAAKAENQGK